MTPPSQTLDDYLSPEELILQMSRDELQELLGEIGLTASRPMAECIKQLVYSLGTFEAAILALTQIDQTNQSHQLSGRAA
jgi:hypothetical protein